MLNLDDIDDDDREEAAKVFETLALYARYRNRAARHRKNGQMTYVAMLEERCERIYKNLPDWAKW